MPSTEIVDRGPFSGLSLTFLNRARSAHIHVLEEAGIIAVDAELASVASSLQVRAAPSEAALKRSSVPRVAIYHGEAVGYPYWGYYAHALMSIGITFGTIDGAGVVRGDLGRFDLLVLPGGFATWGLDRAEGLVGIDGAIRRFVDRGGRILGSCGGAFYLSAGRPGWLGAIDAMPKFTQEYLSSGSALISISGFEGRLGWGMAEAAELPYFHGPIYTNAQRRASTLACFRSYISANSAFIDNPLDSQLFKQEMAGAPAVLSAHFGDGAVLAFSPHPEMGEFVRKGMILDGYIRRFLPIRGERVLDETLRFFAADDAAGFLLIHNAIGVLGLFDGETSAGEGEDPPQAEEDLAIVLDEAQRHCATSHADIQRQAEALDPGMRSLIRAELDRRIEEAGSVFAELRQLSSDGSLAEGLTHSLSVSLQAAGRNTARATAAGLAEQLVLAELPLRLCAAGLRIAHCDRALGH